MAEVFEAVDTVFFVGGIGTKAGTTPAGGVTRAKYEAMVVEDGYFDMTRIMGANGACKFTIEDAAVTNNGGFVMLTKAGEFAGVESGMIAYVSFLGSYGSGIYELTYINSDAVTINSLEYVSNTAAIVQVGGAWDSLQTVLDNTDVTINNIWLLTNKDETLSSTLDIIDGGNLSGNKHLYIWGFNTTPPANLFEPSGDMDFNETTKTAGIYYSSSLAIKLNGGSASAGKKVVLDGNDAAIQLVTLTNVQNTHFRNFEFKDVADGYDLIGVSGALYNTTFCGCSHTGNYKYVMDAGGGSTYSIFFYDCYFRESQYHSTLRINGNMYGSLFLNCIFDLGSNTRASIPFAVFLRCIFIDGVYGTKFITGFAESCTFYNQSDAPIYSNNPTQQGHVLNCIVVPAAGATDFAAYVYGGSLGLWMNNSYYGADGVALAMSFNQSGSPFTPFGGGNLAQDPAMVDPANNNFKPRNQDVLTRGLSDVNGNPSQIGAVVSKHRFVSKAGLFSPGRMKIFR
jgi:hypothetical protein